MLWQTTPMPQCIRQSRRFILNKGNMCMCIIGIAKTNPSTIEDRFPSMRWSDVLCKVSSYTADVSCWTQAIRLHVHAPHLCNRHDDFGAACMHASDTFILSSFYSDFAIVSTTLTLIAVMLHRLSIVALGDLINWRSFLKNAVCLGRQ